MARVPVMMRCQGADLNGLSQYRPLQRPIHFGQIKMQANSQGYGLEAVQQSGDDSMSFSVVRQQAEAPSKTLLGFASQPRQSAIDVAFYPAKGGFCGLVKGPDWMAVVLPGGKLRLPEGTEVALMGVPASPKYGKPMFPSTDTRPQQVTRQAMILGAGVGSRFFPLSGEETQLAKPAVPMNGEDSVIVTLAKLLYQHGIRRVLVNTFAYPKSVKDELLTKVQGTLPGMTVHFIDEAAPSGTAGGLVKALKTPGLVDPNEPILVMNGDAVVNFDLSRLLNSHKEHGAPCTIALYGVDVSDVTKIAMVKTDGSNPDGGSGYVQYYKEKPSVAQWEQEAQRTPWGSIGFYVLSPQVFPWLEAQGDTKFSKQDILDYAMDVYPGLMSGFETLKKRLKATFKSPMVTIKSPIYGQILDGYWSDIGQPDQYMATMRDWMQGNIPGLPSPSRMASIDEVTSGVRADSHHALVDEDSPIFWPGARSLAQGHGLEASGDVIIMKRPQLSVNA